MAPRVVLDREARRDLRPRHLRRGRHLLPMSKNVAGAPYCSSTDSTAGVEGPGPSSKVSATTRWPAVAAPPGAWYV